MLNNNVLERLDLYMRKEKIFEALGKKKADT